MLKRLFDITACLVALPFLFPFFAVVAIIIKFNSQGSVFYRGLRTGLGGRPFRIFKFRTMVVDAEKIGGPSTALNDPRLTIIGKFLRKYKIDELPQLINILTGEMSFVGPRPQVEKYTKLYNDEEQIILSVRPGLTDYASIKFINLDQILGDESVDERYLKEIEPEKNKLRMKYAKEHSFWIDIKIILMTFMQMLKIQTLWNIKD
ncbi:MAG: sugar transferase [Bacteroidales bacterium]|nr:sugar transferase [Bacteroidales bacterium]